MMRLPGFACTGLVLLAACSDGATVGEPVVIASTQAHRPTVALEPGGTDAYIAWISGDSVYDVMLARVSRDGPLGDAVRVNHLAGDAAPHAQAPAQVAVGPEGNVYVVWQNNTHVEGRRFPASDLRFARSTDGGHTFEPAVYVNDDAGGPPTSHTFHDVAVAADGTIYVSWIDGRGGDQSSQIRVARSLDQGRSFEAGVIIAEGACPCCRTALAVDGTRVFVAWRDIAAGSIRDIVVARSVDRGSTWGEPRPVHSDGWRIDGCPHAGPALAVTADGRLHAAWYTGAPDRPGIHYASADSTLTFGVPRPLLTGAWVPPSLVALAAAGERVIAAWDDRRSDAPAVHVGAPADAAHAAAVDGLAPAIAMNGGTRVVAWLRGDSVMAAFEELP